MFSWSFILLVLSRTRSSGKVVLKGIHKDGLYTLQSSDPSNKPVQLKCHLTSKQFLSTSTTDVQDSSFLPMNNFVFSTTGSPSSRTSMCTSETTNKNSSVTSLNSLSHFCALTSTITDSMSDINVWHLKLGPVFKMP